MQELIKVTEENLKFYKKLAKVVQLRYGLNLSRMITCEGVHGHIYFLKDNVNGNVKIGTTKNLEKRKKQISNKNDDLEFVKVLDVPLELSINIKVERFLHKRYEEYRKKGEWFSECVVDLFEKEFSDEDYCNLVQDLSDEVVLKVLKNQLGLKTLKKVMNFIKKSLEPNCHNLDEFEKLDLQTDKLFYELLDLLNKMDIDKINNSLEEVSKYLYFTDKNDKYHWLFNGEYHV